MSTFVLFWNPAISSFKIENYRDFFNERPDIYSLNWSIWEHEKAEFGDNFVMIRCKTKPIHGKVNSYGKPLWEPCIDDTTGICMVGTFDSQPYQDEDWSGKGRETYYVDLDIEHMSDPDNCIIVNTEELMAAIPSFEWKGGHSGRLLDESSAQKLKSMIDAAVKSKKDQIWSQEYRMFY